MKYCVLVLLALSTYSYSTDGEDLITLIANATPAQIEAWVDDDLHCDEDIFTSVEFYDLETDLYNLST